MSDEKKTETKQECNCQQCQRERNDLLVFSAKRMRINSYLSLAATEILEGVSPENWETLMGIFKLLAEDVGRSTVEKIRKEFEFAGKTFDQIVEAINRAKKAAERGEKPV